MGELLLDPFHPFYAAYGVPEAFRLFRRSYQMPLFIEVRHHCLFNEIPKRRHTAVEGLVFGDYWAFHSGQSRRLKETQKFDPMVHFFLSASQFNPAIHNLAPRCNGIEGGGVKMH